MAATTIRRYYGIEYPHGIASDSATGGRYGNYLAFRTRAARDRWVAAGPAYRGESGYREAISGSDAELRRILRADARAEEAGASPTVTDAEEYARERADLDAYLDAVAEGRAEYTPILGSA